MNQIRMTSQEIIDQCTDKATRLEKVRKRLVNRLDSVVSVLDDMTYVARRVKDLQRHKNNLDYVAGVKCHFEELIDTQGDGQPLHVPTALLQSVVDLCESILNEQAVAV